jgi:hypothetical protein
VTPSSTGSGRGVAALFDPVVAAPAPTAARRIPPSSSRPRRRRPEIRPRRGDSLPTRAAAQAPGGAAEVRRRRTERCGRRVVVVVASLAWGTEDRRPATAWSGPGRGGPWPALLFFHFFCAVSIWVAHDKERVTPSRWGRPSTPFLCRASHVAHDKDLCRALPFPTAHDKGLCRAKMRCAPFAVRPGRIRTQRLCRAPGQNPHGKGCAVRVLASTVCPWRTAKACGSGSDNVRCRKAKRGFRE